jgi:hypothetical protein
LSQEKLTLPFVALEGGFDPIKFIRLLAHALASLPAPSVLLATALSGERCPYMAAKDDYKADYEGVLENYRNAWQGLRMIREAVETLGPPALCCRRMAF